MPDHTALPPVSNSSPAALNVEARSLVTTVTASYKKLNALYFGRAEVERVGLQPGKVSLLIASQPAFTAVGTLSPAGGLSGMARAYHELKLQSGDTLACVATGPSQLLVTGTQRSPALVPPDTAPHPVDSVFLRQRLRPIHIEPFSPENLNRWEPENTPDLHLAFGVLQEYTRFRYCCATSQPLLDRLGFAADTKPDAILINDHTGEYVVAAFTLRSASFKADHQPSDVDVLVVWCDDETDRTKLPPDVLCLRDIARAATPETINDR